MRFQKLAESLQPVDQEAFSFLFQAPEGSEIEVKVVTGKRTSQQNKSMWKYCELLAKALDDAGMDFRTYPFREGLRIPFSKDSVMDTFWRPVMEAMTGKVRTSDLDRAEVNAVYEALDRAMSERVGVHVEFPSEESR